MSAHLYATIRDLGARVRVERARADAAEERERAAMQALAEAQARLVNVRGSSDE